MDSEAAVIEAAIEEMEAGRTIRDENFPEQDRFVMDPAHNIAALCTRRAGKTTGLGLRFLRTMQRYPDSMCRYIALTRDSAKDIMWGALQELDDRFELGAVFKETTLTMTLPENGAKLKLFGADMKNFIRRLKGVKSPGVAIDEVQDFGPHIEQLIDDILEPSLADYADSWLALTGTPGPIPRGLFYKITQEGYGGYGQHRWSLYDNPYMPDPHGFVERLKEKKKWGAKHPTLLREYQGIWVLDVQSLFIHYDAALNDYDILPPGNYNYILGVDVGHRDADALAVIAWSESSPHIYLVEEVITSRQDITELSNQIKAMMKKYQISKIIMDEGALGKKIAEEIRRRKHLPVQAADKARKMENAAFLNEWLRLSLFKAKKESRFALDSYQLQVDHEKSTPSKQVLRKGFHSDIIDAVLYGFKESPGFTYQKPKEKPRPGSQEWAKEEVTELERRAEEFFRAKEEAAEGFGVEWT